MNSCVVCGNSCKRKCCSSKCASVLANRAPRRSYRCQRKKVVKKCLQCGQSIICCPSQLRKYCSKECRSIGQSGNGNSFFGKTHSIEQKEKWSKERKGVYVAWNKGLTHKDDERILAGERSPTYGKAYRTKETDPAWAVKISNTLKEQKHSVGDKNPMKDPDVAARM